METQLLKADEKSVALAAKLLNAGEIVAIPTETVYGLAANAFDESAVAEIFAAKGRPNDNPLIVHISSVDMLEDLAAYKPPITQKLIDAFWPGPMTMIFKKSDRVPLCVTAGLDTVAVRFPSDKNAAAIIKKSGVPLAAPSANSSGKPSPTSARHVFEDLNGKIPLIIDGGECEFGLESTVILLGDEGVTLLRPGAVTVEMLSKYTSVRIADGVLHEVAQDERALSPGMKHKHYSPKTKIVILDGDYDKFKKFIAAHSDENIGAMVFDGEQYGLNVPTVTYGGNNDGLTQAHRLFNALREVDSLGISVAYARNPQKSGVGLAVYNRLIRAAAFEIISLNQEVI